MDDIDGLGVGRDPIGCDQRGVAGFWVTRSGAGLVDLGRNRGGGGPGGDGLGEMRGGVASAMVVRGGGEGEEEEEGEKSEKEDRSHGEDKDFRGVGFYRVSEVHDDSGNGVWIVENIREEEIGRNGSHGWPLTVVKIAVVDSVVGSINWAWNVKQVKPSHLPPGLYVVPHTCTTAPLSLPLSL